LASRVARDKIIEKSEESSSEEESENESAPAATAKGGKGGRPRKTVAASKQKNASGISNVDGGNCVCSGIPPPSSKHMIECDGCKVWYHNICVGLEDKENVIASGATYLCTTCVNAKKKKVTTKKRSSHKDIENRTFASQLKLLNLALKEIPADGHCLFNAIADQLKREEEEDLYRGKTSASTIEEGGGGGEMGGEGAEKKDITGTDQQQAIQFETTTTAASGSPSLSTSTGESAFAFSVRKPGPASSTSTTTAAAAGFPMPKSKNSTPNQKGSSEDEDFCVKETPSICKDISSAAIGIGAQRASRRNLAAVGPGQSRTGKSLRGLAVQYIREHKDDFCAFLELNPKEDFDGYCRRMERSASWGGHTEIVALSHALKRNIEVFRVTPTEDNATVDGRLERTLFPVDDGSCIYPGRAMQISYHMYEYDGEHYNSVVPTVSTRRLNRFGEEELVALSDKSWGSSRQVVVAVSSSVMVQGVKRDRSPDRNKEPVILHEIKMGRGEGGQSKSKSNNDNNNTSNSSSNKPRRGGGVGSGRGSWKKQLALEKAQAAQRLAYDEARAAGEKIIATTMAVADLLDAGIAAARAINAAAEQKKKTGRGRKKANVDESVFDTQHLSFDNIINNSTSTPNNMIGGVQGWMFPLPPPINVPAPIETLTTTKGKRKSRAEIQEGEANPQKQSQEVSLLLPPLPSQQQEEEEKGQGAFVAGVRAINTDPVVLDEEADDDSDGDEDLGIQAMSSSAESNSIAALEEEPPQQQQQQTTATVSSSSHPQEENERPLKQARFSPQQPQQQQLQEEHVVNSNGEFTTRNENDNVEMRMKEKLEDEEMTATRED
jgi:hypothetical protein